MFPIGDDNSNIKIFPVVTYALIALNVLFFFVELGGGTAFIERWAFVPARLWPTLSGIL
jgi:membrane associated rhomboid family serine protease